MEDYFTASANDVRLDLDLRRPAMPAAYTLSERVTPSTSFAASSLTSP